MPHEYVGNIHLHSTHSDGHATLAEIVAIAGQAGLDFVIPTDHNIYVADMDGWYNDTLLLVGEEIHDIHRHPQANHLLVFNVGEELVQYAPDPQVLIDAVNDRGGFSFIAHPFEHSGAYANEPELNWVNWEVTGFAGQSIWNYMSEFKCYTRDIPSSLFAAFFPQAIIRGPYPETLAKWDELLCERRISIIGASDAHGTTYHLGPLSRVLFPYGYLFRAVNTHILTPEPFNHQLEHDAHLVYESLRTGCGFVAYDLLGSAKGFRFIARNSETEVSMGGELSLEGGVELDISTPLPADIRLLGNGQELARVSGCVLTYTARQSGAYRVEAYRRSWGRKRGWIFGNPVYVTE